MGKYISQMPWKPTRLIVSDLTRARETFEILLEALPKNVAPTIILPSLREGRPCQVTSFSYPTSLYTLLSLPLYLSLYVCLAPPHPPTPLF